MTGEQMANCFCKCWYGLTPCDCDLPPPSQEEPAYLATCEQVAEYVAQYGDPVIIEIPRGPYVPPGVPPGSEEGQARSMTEPALPWRGGGLPVTTYYSEDRPGETRCYWVGTMSPKFNVCNLPNWAVLDLDLLTVWPTCEACCAGSTEQFYKCPKCPRCEDGPAFVYTEKEASDLAMEFLGDPEVFQYQSFPDNICYTLASTNPVVNVIPPGGVDATGQIWNGPYDCESSSNCCPYSPCFDCSDCGDTVSVTTPTMNVLDSDQNVVAIIDPETFACTKGTHGPTSCTYDFYGAGGTLPGFRFVRASWWDEDEYGPICTANGGPLFYIEWVRVSCTSSGGPGAVDDWGGGFGVGYCGCPPVPPPNTNQCSAACGVFYEGPTGEDTCPTDGPYTRSGAGGQCSPLAWSFPGSFLVS